MATEAIETTDKKVEAPERIWLLQAVINHFGTKDFIVPLGLRSEAVEYIRADSTRQRAERAAMRIHGAIVDRSEGRTIRVPSLTELTDIITAEFEK